MDSSTTHNFVTRHFVQKLGVTSIMDATLNVTLADWLVVRTTQAATLHLQLYDDRGHFIPHASTSHLPHSGSNASASGAGHAVALRG